MAQNELHQKGVFDNTADTAEIWRPVVGYPNYEVSNLGRVRSINYVVNRKYGDKIVRQTVRGRVRRSYFSNKRKVVLIVLSICGKISTKKVHHLVLEAFIGPRPMRMYGCHGDGNPENNSLGNLRWDTPTGNSADSKRHGTFRAPPILRGSANKRTRLSDDDIRSIRAERAAGARGCSLSKKYMVSEGHISGILRRKYRKEVI